jgi:hypothetical protein
MGPTLRVSVHARLGPTASGMECFGFASRGSKAAAQKVINGDITPFMPVAHGAVDLRCVLSAGDRCPAATKEDGTKEACQQENYSVVSTEQGRAGSLNHSPSIVPCGGGLNLFQIQIQNKFKFDLNCFKA